MSPEGPPLVSVDDLRLLQEDLVGFMYEGWGGEDR